MNLIDKKKNFQHLNNINNNNKFLLKINNKKDIQKKKLKEKK